MVKKMQNDSFQAKNKNRNVVITYNDIYLKNNGEQLQPPPPKAGRRTRLSEIYSTKTYQILFEIRGSNQTGRIWCISLQNAQSRVHVAQAHHRNSVFQSAGGNLNANNTCCLKGNKNRNKKAGTEHASRQISSTVEMLANIKNFTTNEVNHRCRNY